MTTIRKIVTSKIDGSGADSNDINEIRPFGEIAVYVNTEPNPDKLTLMMFDGTRTNLKSMVLAPGRLYGADADSGDGNGRDTIKLIPDASLSDYTGNDQYLIIDPTDGEPGHIHIRAGGVRDSSGADLYLGAEQTFVRVSDTSDNVVIRTSVLGEGVFPYSWTFDNTGKLTLPGTIEYANGTLATGGGLVTPPGTDYIIGTQQLQTVSAECAPRGSGNNFVADITDNDDIIVVQEGWTVDIDGTTYTVTTVINFIGEFDIFATGATFVPGTIYTFTNPTILAYDWSFGLDGVLSTPGLGTISHRNNDLKVEVSGTDVIVLRTAGGELVLNANGSLMFNDGSTQTIAYTGGRVVSVPGSSLGAAGDQQGDIAYNGSYIYYCSQNFAEASYSSTIVLTYSGTFPSIVKGNIPQPQAGWILVHNGNSYTLDFEATEDNPGEWTLSLSSSISVTIGDSVTLGPATPIHIWKRVAWSADTW